MAVLSEVTTSRRFVLPFVTRDCDHVTNALPPFGQWVQGQISLSTAFQAERMFPLYILHHTYGKTKRMNPHGFILFLYYVLSRPPSGKPDNAALNG